MSARRRRRLPALAALVAGCLMAGALALVLRGEGSTEACREQAHTPPLAAPGSRHPAQSFYTPGEEVPSEDLAHRVGHGYAIVTYLPGISQPEQDALADWAVSADFVVVAPAGKQQTETVRAATAKRRLSCSETDVEALTDFRDRWFESAGL